MNSNYNKKVRIAVIADLHLSSVYDTVQYRTLDFAIKSISEHSPDIVVSLGDMTSCGELSAAKAFISETEKIKIPKLFIMGNSDIRKQNTQRGLDILETDKKITVNGLHLIGINSSNGVISESDRQLLADSDENTIVFLHHPPKELANESRAFFEEFLRSHNILGCVYGHLHYYEHKGNEFCMPALDPDKAIGNPPCVSYMEVESGNIDVTFDYFPFENISNIREYIGLSCFNWTTDIDYAAEHNLKNIELRPGVIHCKPELLLEKIESWREKCGKYLSLHFPDIGYDDGLIGADEFQQAIEMALYLQVDGITVHVPKISVKQMKGDTESEIISFLEKQIRRLPEKCCVGIENMHMTAGEKPDDNRRFGYRPEECLKIVELINSRFGFERIGTLLDVGHARNNSIFSWDCNLGVWYSTAGKYAVAYHIHQVCVSSTGLKNHMPIFDLFGPLISYCGFFDSWNIGQLRKSPIFLEIHGGKEKFEPSLQTILDFDS